MSRIGLKPVPVPDGVKVELGSGTARFKGPKGAMELTIHSAMKVSLRDGQLIVERPDDQKANKALHGLTRSLLASAVLGVNEGYERVLEIEGVGFTGKSDGKKLTLQVGFANPVQIPIPAGVKVQTPTNQRIVVQGCDKQVVGQFAANVRRARPPEPYKGKGIRFTGERVQRKAGKAFVSGEK